MQACDRGAKVAVLDTIHGARVIAQKMVESGLEAEAFEVYHHNPDLSGFDLIAAPIHLSPANPAIKAARDMRKKVISHHQAVGELICRQGSPAERIFEVTGTHSKTSTALLLAKILSRHAPALSHTTRGIEIWQDGVPTILKKGLSIAPGNVILAAEEALSQSACNLICEVSLGGVGIGGYGILTSLQGDYLIAGGSRWASTAKLQMLSLARKGMRFVANSNSRLSPDLSFSVGGRVYAMPDRLIFGSTDVRLDLGADLDFQGYETAISAASAAAYAAGVDKEDIAAALSGFDGFAGRMKIIRMDDQTIFDSSNSGLKVKDVERALDRALGEDLIAVVGEESETVCEGMNIPDLTKLLRRRRGELAGLVLVGNRLHLLADELRADVAGNLDEGLEMAQSRRPKRILSCVKCFR